MNQHFHLVLLLLAMLWAGLVLGISFIAQPAKFRAPGLTRPIALAVGRRIFRAMHLAESVLATGAMLLVVWCGGPWRTLVFAAALTLLVQVVALMPPLSRRVDAALSGQTLPSSAHHMVFAALELAKLLFLLAFAGAPLLAPN